jgi:hypothetical protein
MRENESGTMKPNLMSHVPQEKNFPIYSFWSTLIGSSIKW